MASLSQWSVCRKIHGLPQELVLYGWPLLINVETGSSHLIIVIIWALKTSFLLFKHTKLETRTRYSDSVFSNSIHGSIGTWPNVFCEPKVVIRA